MSDTIKNLIITLVVIGIIIVLYILFIAGKNEKTANGLITTSQQTVINRSRQTVQTINKLKSLDLSADYLDSPAFDSLVNYGLILNNQPIGRPNPFAKIQFQNTDPLYRQAPNLIENPGASFGNFFPSGSTDLNNNHNMMGTSPNKNNQSTSTGSIFSGGSLFGGL